MSHFLVNKFSFDQFCRNRSALVVYQNEKRRKWQVYEGKTSKGSTEIWTKSELGRKKER